MGMDQTLSCADKHATNLYLMMMLMQARRLPTRDERVAYMTGQIFRGPHGGSVRVSHEVAEYAADLIEHENHPASAD